ncbi:MAG: J domain-containing protein [bacterium]|nr:J domain-containing protein [bacterium]MCP5069377.1 J domain-containing protein [bacterium]
MAPLAEAEIRALADLLDELDYYQLLEIDPSAQGSQIKQAYYAASRRYHPDANRLLEGEISDHVHAISKRITEAYQVLRDPRRRRAYDAMRNEGGGARIQLVDAAARADKQARDQHEGTTPNGRRFFSLARLDVERGDKDAAIRNVKMAMTFEPKNTHFKAMLVELRGA